jgi:UDP-glucose 4-epimerase
MPISRDAAHGGRPDAVLHLAAWSACGSVQTGLYAQRHGTENVLARCGPVRRFLRFQRRASAATDAAYSETHTLQPIPYGRTKAMAEDLLSRSDGQMEVVSLRYGNVYGPGQDSSRGNGVVSIFLDSLRRGRRPEVLGDGGQVRDYVFVGDVARANQIASGEAVAPSYRTEPAMVNRSAGWRIAQLAFVTGASPGTTSSSPRVEVARADRSWGGQNGVLDRVRRALKRPRRAGRRWRTAFS